MAIVEELALTFVIVIVMCSAFHDELLGAVSSMCSRRAALAIRDLADWVRRFNCLWARGGLKVPPVPQPVMDWGQVHSAFWAVVHLGWE